MTREVLKACILQISDEVTKESLIDLFEKYKKNLERIPCDFGRVISISAKNNYSELWIDVCVEDWDKYFSSKLIEIGSNYE